LLGIPIRSQKGERLLFGVAHLDTPSEEILSSFEFLVKKPERQNPTLYPFRFEWEKIGMLTILKLLLDTKLGGSHQAVLSLVFPSQTFYF
jgi:hypothetical protein